MKERVVITGMGAVSPAGLGIKCLWKACLQQKTLYQDIFPHWKNNFHFHLNY